MILFVLGITLVLTGVGLFIFAKGLPTRSFDSNPRLTMSIIAGASLVVGLLIGLPSFFYTQSVGQASVITNLGGTINSQNVQPGFAFKLPWQQRHVWDLFSQSVTYAGSVEAAPLYTGGEVVGASITTSVKGGAQADFDMSVAYNLNGDKVTDLFRTYRTQERFTKQIIEPKILAIVRDIPSVYSPVEFRGEKRGEAQAKMLERLNEELNAYGVEVTVVNLQNIVFTEEVENSIRAVEVAQQKEAEAEANLRATEVSAQAQVVEAEAAADARRIQAQGESDANELLEESLTDKVLQQKWIDAIRDNENSVIVIPDGAAPLINLNGVPTN